MLSALSHRRCEPAFLNLWEKEGEALKQVPHVIRKNDLQQPLETESLGTQWDAPETGWDRRKGQSFELISLKAQIDPSAQGNQWL